MSSVIVTDRPEASRFVLEADGQTIGFLTYRLGDGQLILTHAEVPPSHGNQGYGSRLVAYALDEARARGLEVLPVCPFVSAYIRRHSKYADLIPADLRGRFGLAA